MAATLDLTSVGSRGDSYDNALAETIIGLEATYWRTQTQTALTDSSNRASSEPGAVHIEWVSRV